MIPELSSPIILQQEGEKKKSPRSLFRGQSLKMIPQQAHDVKSGLIKTKQIAAEWMNEVDALDSLGGTFNHVFAIGEVGFLKIGNKGNNASAIMERLVWEIASLFHVENLFSPTTEMVISPKKSKKMSIELTQETRFKQIRTRSYSLDAISGPSHLKGSFQITEKGIPLGQIIDKKESLTSYFPNQPRRMDHLISAMITSLGFGMMDAHAANIFVSQEATYRFIDNTRSFPNSNSVYASNNNICLSYRCGLLELKECHQILTEEQKRFLISETEKFKDRLPAFEAFIRSDEIQRRIAELPMGWLDTEKMLQATRERVERLHLGALSSHVKTLVDLVFETIPYYRFFSLFSFIKNLPDDLYPKKSFWRGAVVDAPLVPIADIIVLCHQYSLNPYTLLGLSTQSNFSFERFHQELMVLIASSKIPPSADTMLYFSSHFFELASVDLKDIPLDEIKPALRSYIEESFFVAEVPTEIDLLNDYYYIDTNKEPFTLHINTYSNIKKEIHLDIYSFPGLIKFLDLPPMKIPDFKKYIEKYLLIG